MYTAKDSACGGVGGFVAMVRVGVIDASESGILSWVLPGRLPDEELECRVRHWNQTSLVSVEGQELWQ